MSEGEQSQGLEIVDPEFLEFLKQGIPTLGYRITQEARAYLELKSYGWSQQDLICAAKTGYNYFAHLTRPGWSRYRWKEGMGPGPLEGWLKHYYRCYKAEKAGIPFEDFVHQWCAFGDDEKVSSLERIEAYVRARRSGVDSQEAIHVACMHHYDDRMAHIYLRYKGLGRQLVDELVCIYRIKCRRKYFTLEVKYIVEAHRRGASSDQLLGSVGAAGQARELALSLRHPNAPTAS